MLIEKVIEFSAAFSLYILMKKVQNWTQRIELS